MSLDIVLGKFRFNGFSPAEESRLRDALTTLYSAPLGANMLEDIVRVSNLININKTSGDVQTNIQSTSIEFNPDVAYIGVTKKGESFSVSDAYVLCHELKHLEFGGVNDPNLRLSSDLSIGYYDNLTEGQMLGLVEESAIAVLRQVGLEKFRGSYLATSKILQPGIDFTGGTEVSQIIVVRDFMPESIISAAGDSRDLIVADGNRSQLFNSGDGEDFIYAGAGDDSVDGWAGNDFLDGGGWLRHGLL